jgi:hypothetical protein
MAVQVAATVGRFAGQYFSTATAEDFRRTWENPPVVKRQ